MHVFYGDKGLTDFQCEKLLHDIRHIQPSLTGLKAQEVFFIDASDFDSDQLISILSASAAFSEQASVIKCPRFGTQTPWSTKATDILKHCGFDGLNRIEKGMVYYLSGSEGGALSQEVINCLHDPLTETVLTNLEQAKALFVSTKATSFSFCDVLSQGKAAIDTMNRSLGLALSIDEVDYLVENYQLMQKNPTDVELMMFAQANSEHCRHKIFNADWVIDSKTQTTSLFNMIKNTYQACPDFVLSAYHDNAAVSVGNECQRFYPEEQSNSYRYHDEMSHLVMKVETHNHPTGIAPYPGAATGAGGEIRDEGATGRGAKPKAGLCGYSVSNLTLPDLLQPWEEPSSQATHLASALSIMLQAPIGAASFNNEFGRPNLCGYFRTFEMTLSSGAEKDRFGYSKPIMIVGGVGSIRQSQVKKLAIPAESPLVVIGGPAMNIGLGGGAASSMNAGDSSIELDFASVQRANPEMQRRCQEVIDKCWAKGESNPILAIHDVGAGGLSNAMPELVNDADKGAIFNLRAIPNAEPGLSPLAIWCNEAQERYVLAIDSSKLDVFKLFCQRERCPMAVIGYATDKQQLLLSDDKFENLAVDMPLDVLLGKVPKMQRVTERTSSHTDSFDYSNLDLNEISQRVLQLPSVASKLFLITIGDRSVGGLVTRDQLVGPWQVPVADCAVTMTDFVGHCGDAMSMGERAPVALLDAKASARLCVGEAITNIAAAPIDDLKRIKLSANWMAACNKPGEDAKLFDAVKAIGLDLCPKLGLTIPVGKDSLSMQAKWQGNGVQEQVSSPLSLIISAFAPVTDIRNVLTPQLKTDEFDNDESTRLLLIDLGQGRNRLGGSAMMQVYNALGDVPPDLDDATLLQNFFAFIQHANQQNHLLAYHDRSDGGLYACLCEMAFTSSCGLSIDVSSLGQDLTASLFSEELGAVIQVKKVELEQIQQLAKQYQLSELVHDIGHLTDSTEITIHVHGEPVLAQDRIELHRLWQKTSFQLQSLRDNPDCAKQEFDSLLDRENPGLQTHLTFPMPSYVKQIKNPPLAILREQGVNGHIEMAAAFHRAGFNAVDVHMSDILEGRVSLTQFAGLVACGGFSYGDVLGAGRGWAATIMHNQRALDEFSAFFASEDTFALGVCNGCQMLSQLKSIIPNTFHWPEFVTNLSHQFEARLSLVRIDKSPSLLFDGMNDSLLPVVISHGEGRVHYASDAHLEQASSSVCMRYADNHGKVTQSYPANPNGSVDGQAALTSTDGRFTIMMPHPERVFRPAQFSWRPREWEDESPWMQLFINAYKAIG